MKKVSIIVPVYNDADYLSECVAHLLGQTYPMVEIILIDNCSEDSSLELCRRYAGKYDNILVRALDKNYGPSTARNIGISMASGEYLCFCDADDYYDFSMVEKMVRLLEETDADYVISDMYAERIASNLGLPWENGTVFVGHQVRIQMMPRYIGNCSDNDKTIPVWGSVVKCIFKKAIIEKKQIQFPVGIHFAEDLIFTLHYLSCIQKAAVLNEVLYFYRYRTNSLMNSYQVYHSEMRESRFEVLSEIKRIMEATEIYEQNKGRLHTTARAYIKECVGNAGKNRSFADSLREIRAILREDTTREAFQHFDARDHKNRVIYTCIRQKCVLFLTAYYRIRSGGNK